MGDLENTPTLKNEIENDLKNNILSNVPEELQPLFIYSFWGRWRYRYLFVNKYAHWLWLFYDLMQKNKLEFDLRFSGYLEINKSWIDLDIAIETVNEMKGNSNVSRETSGTNKTTTINTSVTESTAIGENTQSNTSHDVTKLDRDMNVSRETSETTTNNLTDKTTYNITDSKTGTDTTTDEGGTTEKIDMSLNRTGTDSTEEIGSSRTTTDDNTVTTTTNDLTDGQIGVKTTSSSPAADTVTKVIQTALAPPMNAVDGVAGQGEDKKIYADNLGVNDPFTVNSQGYTSTAAETITITNLQREANGNYKSNITAETYGEINNTTGLYEPLKTTHTGTSATAVSKAEGAEHTTEVDSSNNINTTVSHDTTDKTTGTNTTTENRTSTVEYNNNLKRTGDETTLKTGTVTSEGTGSDTTKGTDTTTTDLTGNVTTNLNQTTTTKGLDDDSHNLTATSEQSGNVTDTTENQSTGNSNTKGYNRSKALLYQDYIDAINKSDLMGWFVNSFNPLFSQSLEMDWREFDEFEEIKGV